MSNVNHANVNPAQPSDHPAQNSGHPAQPSGSANVNLPSPKYSDPLWQEVFYTYLDPWYRAMRLDEDNAFSWICLIIAMMCSNYWRLGFGLFGLLLLYLKRNFICGPLHPVYKETRKYGNSMLYIDNGTPVLMLDGGNAYENGAAYGVLLGDEIIQMVNIFKKFIHREIPVWKLAQINENLPKQIYDELIGIYSSIEHYRPGAITYWDLLAMQLVPELDLVACTCYATRDDNGKIVFGRNMDWLPFSSAQYSVVVYYKQHQYRSLVMPGMVGCLTAWNSHFTIAMNVVGGHHGEFVDRLPSTLFNKYLMIQCRTYEQAIKWATTHDPMAAFHLTIAGYESVECVSYYQDNGQHHRRVFGPDDEYFATLNWTYPGMDNGRNMSARRHQFTNAKRDVAEVLKDCQNFGTIHSLIFTSDTLDIAIDNGHAAFKLAAKR